jgi:hypothetical protein
MRRLFRGNKYTSSTTFIGEKKEGVCPFWKELQFQNDKIISILSLVICLVVEMI